MYNCREVSDQRIGTEIAGYRVLEVVGRGGMGVVYLAEQASPRRKVALKVLSSELAGDPSFRERFIRESDAAASIEHPNIVPIHQAGEQDGVLFIAMRYVEGTDLRSLLDREGRLPAERAASIVTQVAAALDAAHEAGLVHRDVKPGNVLIGRGDHAYLTDFGLIKRSESGTALTRTGQFMGTVDYVAPEQIRGEPVDGRADVYSLGCLLYESLTGEPPFPSDLDVTGLYAHLEQPPPKVTTSRPDLPPAIDAVVAKAMAKRPGERYATAGELASAARDALGPTPRPAVLAPRPRPARIWVAVASILVVAVAVIAFLLLRHGTSTPAPHASAGQSSTTSANPVALPVGSVVQLDPGTGKVLTVALNAIGADVTPGNPRLAVGEGGVWAHTIGTVSHVDQRTGKLEDSFGAGTSATGGAGAGTSSSIAVGARTVWIPTGGGIGGTSTVLLPIDPATNSPLSPIRLGSGITATDAAIGAGGVWVTLSDGSLVDVDAATHQIVHSFAVGGHLDALTIGFGSIWVIDEVASRVSRVDPATGDVTATVGVSGNVWAIVAGAGAVWILDRFSGTVAAIDPVANTLGQAIRVGDRPTGMATGAGAVWVSDSGGSVWRVDPVTRTSSETPVAGPLTAIAFDPQSGNLWLCVGGGPG